MKCKRRDILKICIICETRHCIKFEMESGILLLQALWYLSVKCNILLGFIRFANGKINTRNQKFLKFRFTKTREICEFEDSRNSMLDTYTDPGIYKTRTMIYLHNCSINDTRSKCKNYSRYFFHTEFLAARHYYEAKIARTIAITTHYYRMFLPLRLVQQVMIWPILLPAFFDSPNLDDNYPIHWGRNVLSHIRLSAIALWFFSHRANRIAPLF